MSAANVRQSDPVEDFLQVVWQVIKAAPRTLVWVAVWVWWWSPWDESAGRGPVDSALVVVLVLVFIGGLMWMTGGLIPPVRWLMWMTTPWGDVRRFVCGTGGRMRPVLDGMGLLDSMSRKPLPGVKVAGDRQAGVYSVTWPTGIRPETPDHLDRLAVAQHAHLGACRHDEPRVARGRWVITWHRDPAPDPLAVASPYPPTVMEGCLLEAVTLGVREDGGAWTHPVLGAHTLIVGASGSGKGSVLWSLVLGIMPAVHSGTVQLHGIDLKGGVEFNVGRGAFATIAHEADAALDRWTELLR